MEKKLFVTELKPYLYLLDEAHEATGYLVIGEHRSCVIDTMMGYNDLRKAVRGITDKPLVVVNTHGHPDHIYGNVYFEEAYMNLNDEQVAARYIDDPEFQEDCRKRGLSMPPFQDIHGGDVIDLGGKTLEVYDLPGHTPGGILLLLKEDRILFTGDSINHHLWMQLPECLSMRAFLAELDKVMFLEEKADHILHGHASGYDDISLLRHLRAGVQELVEGKTDADQPYAWFGGTDLQHPFLFGDKGCERTLEHVICYRNESLK